MKKINELMEDKKLRVVGLVVLGMWCFYFIISAVFLLGEMNMCNNMNGSLVNDVDGEKVCIDFVDVPVCKDSYGKVVEEGVISNYTFNFG